MYRPATAETYKRITEYMRKHEMSWNAAINALVLAGLRAADEAAIPQPRNSGKRYAK